MAGCLRISIGVVLYALRQHCYFADALREEGEDEGEAGVMEGVSGDLFADTWDMLLEHPDEFLTISFAGMCLACLLGTCCSAKEAKKMKDVANRMGELKLEYLGTIADMTQILHNMGQGNAFLVERNFDANSRHFLKYLESNKRYAQSIVGHQEHEELLIPFRGCVTEWVSLFEQCSLDPIDNPRILVTKEELDRCTSVEAVVELIAYRLENSKTQFVQDRIKFLQDQRGDGILKPVPSVSWFQVSCWEGFAARRVGSKDASFPVEISCGFVKMTLVSSSHVAYVLGIFVGLALIVWEVLWDQMVFVGVAAFGMMILFFILYTYEDANKFAQLSREIRQLQEENRLATENRQETNELHETLCRLLTLWRYRTLPLLAMFKELHEQVRDCPDEDRLAMLSAVLEMLQIVNHSMGPLDLYIGSFALPEKKLKIVAYQIERATDFFSEQRSHEQSFAYSMRRLTNLFAFIHIRICAAYDLTNKSKLAIVHLHTPDPKVTLKLESMESPVSTATVMSNLNPVWESEEFFLLASADDMKLQIEVWDDRKVRKQDNHLGIVRVDFRQLPPGVWHQQLVNLTSLKKSTEKASTLRYEIFVGDEVKHLALIPSSVIETDFSEAKKLEQLQ